MQIKALDAMNELVAFSNGKAVKGTVFQHAVHLRGKPVELCQFGGVVMVHCFCVLKLARRL